MFKGILPEEVRMKKFTIAAIAALSIASSGVVYAQYHRPWMSEHMRHMRMDRKTAPPSSMRGSPPFMPG